MNASRSKQPETLGIENNPSFFLQFIDEFKSGLVKYIAVGLLSLIGLGLSWLWGWYAAGGLSDALSGIPSGAVVAFVRADQCPDNWELFDKARGKFIVGVDDEKLRLTFTKEQPDFDTGGDPEHDHEIKYEVPEHVKPVPKGADTIAFVRHGSLKVEGESNMPPFIALNYCRKL